MAHIGTGSPNVQVAGLLGVYRWSAASSHEDKRELREIWELPKNPRSMLGGSYNEDPNILASIAGLPAYGPRPPQKKVS